MLNKLKLLDADHAAKLTPIIDSLVDDVREIVAGIESETIKTTKNHYGRYMSAISASVPDGLNSAERSTMVLIIACAMEKAGGNAAGIDAAANLIA